MNEDRSQFQSSIFWLGLTLWFSFIPLIFLAPRQELFEMLNAVVFSVAVGVVVGYAPGVWEALRGPLKDLRAGDALQIGIAIGWGATALVFGVLWWWRLTGQDNLVMDHGVNAFSRWVLCTAGFMHLAAAGSVDGRVPYRAYLRAGMMTAIGLVMGAIVITIAHGRLTGL